MQPTRLSRPSSETLASRRSPPFFHRASKRPLCRCREHRPEKALFRKWRCSRAFAPSQAPDYLCGAFPSTTEPEASGASMQCAFFRSRFPVFRLLLSRLHFEHPAANFGLASSRPKSQLKKTSKTQNPQKLIRLFGKDEVLDRADFCGVPGVWKWF